jgi:hypothetical protein
VEGNQVTPLYETPAIVLVVLAWFAAPPTSLADAARREAVRRLLMPQSVASLNNVGQPGDVPPPAAAVTLPPGEAPPAEKPPVAAPEPPAEPPKDEKWWRGRITAARNTLERDEFLAASVQSRINSLQADVVNVDDPARQGLLRQQLGKALNELDRLQKQIEADRQAIADIQAEARRARVPPGWIR